MTEKLNILKGSQVHVNWSQRMRKMGPLWDISKRSVWYSLQDRGDSTNLGKLKPTLNDNVSSEKQQRKALSVLVCNLFMQIYFSAFAIVSNLSWI